MPEVDNDPQSEYGLEKEIRLEACWFGSEEAINSTHLELQTHCRYMRDLQTKLAATRTANRQRRVVKGKEITHPLARSWHK